MGKVWAVLVSLGGVLLFLYGGFMSFFYFFSPDYGGMSWEVLMGLFLVSLAIFFFVVAWLLWRGERE